MSFARSYAPEWLIEIYARASRNKSTFFLGVLSGLTLSLASLSTALIASQLRDARRREIQRRLRLAAARRERGANVGQRSKRRGRRRRSASGLGPDEWEQEDSGSSGYSNESSNEGDDSEEDDSRDSWVDIEVKSGHVVRGVEGLIGNTPLMRINSLSELTGCEILGKAEFLNPGGSPKDRVALQILQDAEAARLLHPHTGSCIFEGTVGSTGISLATLAKAKGYECSIVMPDDVASEKRQLLKCLGAEVTLVRPRGIADPKHFVNEARKLAKAFGTTSIKGDAAEYRSSREEQDLVVSSKAKGGASEDPDALEERPRGFFADQFESESNYRAHYRGTGPEIWRQTGGFVSAFVCGAGTGGTLSGVSTYLKRRDAKVRTVLADPQGSSLFNRVKYGVLYSSTEAEGTRRRHQVDTVVEGIGLNRLTRNFSHGLNDDAVDDAERVNDQEAVKMSRFIARHDGLFLGSSSAVNLVAAVRTAVKLKQQTKHQQDHSSSSFSARLAFAFPMLGSGSTTSQSPGASHTYQGSSQSYEYNSSIYAPEEGEGRRAGLAQNAPVVVTILCDSGSRHLSRFWNDEALRELGLDPEDEDIAEMLQTGTTSPL
ncbi:cysteine synthase [Ceraceosorus bombacis]|uniref:cysteine synthase n=1 Tax=Ceraceosorus bombacis TaxID=401625 RepID=A0A0P1BBE5_9BASI|nr:cysteine synthase [Ceraceosorus bombacis]